MLSSSFYVSDAMLDINITLRRSVKNGVLGRELARLSELYRFLISLFQGRECSWNEPSVNYQRKYRGNVRCNIWKNRHSIRIQDFP